ncbi:hypothetical protein [Archangium primigenium]|uniref:hypothetical protein n=1 Tax=[Archangium] primigenium TaxID=2792470 RepID=UPI001958B5AB|nr:hypothetical protein [Archangium primigenium]MBM7116089.1 hypothetical protein [Archangium primigenium]
MATTPRRGFLQVPLRLQALCLDTEQTVVRALADYRRLPSRHDKGDVDDQPNLSGAILTPPFTRDLPLPAGIHLHWMLPQALTRGESDASGIRFPQVPNRWLILRSGGDQPERQWVVESDYLYPEGHGDEWEEQGKGEGDIPVNVMVVPDPAPGPGLRYRFLGRALPLADWRAARSQPGAEYLADLTAAGPEPRLNALDPVRATFASFYPNCRTVFGLHDADFATASPPPGLRYDVLGWYTDASRDCLVPFLDGDPDAETLRLKLDEELQWTLPEGDAVPAASLFHARLTFAAGTRSAVNRVAALDKPLLAVGQTESEALAALMAHRRAPETNEQARAVRRQVEEQLEALQLTERLEGLTLDLDARLLESRHERGFVSHTAGPRWALKPQSDESQDVFASMRRRAPRKARATGLPPAWMGQLQTLNTCQEAYQRAGDELEALRQRMYTAWYDAMERHENVNSSFFEEYVVPVRQRLTSRGVLDLGEGDVTLAPVSFTVVTRESDFFSTYVEVIDAGAPFELSDVDADSYWTWAVEFPNCLGRELSAQHTVKVLKKGEAWEIHDGGGVYPVRASAEGLVLEIPVLATSLASRLAEALRALRDSVAAYNATAEGAAAPYQLHGLPAAPYWEPSEPVLLLSGPAARSDLWGDLASATSAPRQLVGQHVDLSLDLAALPDATLSAVRTHLSGLTSEGDVWSQAPWSPFLMNWYFIVSPAGRKDNGDYDPGLLQRHYQLDTRAVDQRLQGGHEQDFAQEGSVYSGVSLLTPGVTLEVRGRLQRYLAQEVLEDYYAEKNVPGEAQHEGYLAEHFDALLTWYQERQGGAPDTSDPVFTALWTYGELRSTPCLAQSLGNFNQVLMLREPTLQLKISDPLAARDTEQFFYTEAVRDAMGPAVQQRPLTLDIFNPLRTGALSLTGLWLVDTFGQVKEVVDLETPEDTRVITTEDLVPPDNTPQYHMLLPPRLAQPARLRFDFLPAKDVQFMLATEHPDTNPVCGWLLVNNQDRALAVYDQTGRALGSIDQGGTWRTAPGTRAAVRTSAQGLPEFANPHLQQVVRHVLAQGETFLSAFLSTQRTALETIDPASYAEHPSRALLMTRPVAVVRAAITLELQGPPALDPNAIARGQDTTRGVEKVKVPIRLGEFGQLDDGLVGYWRESPDSAGGYTYANEGTFFSPQMRLGVHPRIKTYSDESLLMLRTAADPAQHVTMLLDPRGQVHATTGVLPSEQLRVLPEFYAQALADLEVSFLTAPLLTDRKTLRLPVPEEPGLTWSWTTRQPDGAWAETDKLDPVNPRAAFSATQEVREGWLMLRRSEESGS